MMRKSSGPIRLKIMLCMLLPMALHAASAPQTRAQGPQVSILTGGQVIQILDEPLLSERMSTAAVLRARSYTWAEAARRLREVYAELTTDRLVECS